MAWELIFTRNIVWKALSVLFAVAIWYTINGRQQANDPQRVKDQALVEPKLETPTAIGPLESPEVTTNRVNVAQSFTIRILQPPNDTNRYSLEPSEVILELASNADPAPDLTSPAAIKVIGRVFDCDNIVNLGKTQSRVVLHIHTGTSRHVIQNLRNRDRIGNRLEMLIETFLGRLVVVRHYQKTGIDTYFSGMAGQ